MKLGFMEIFGCKQVGVYYYIYIIYITVDFIYLYKYDSRYNLSYLTYLAEYIIMDKYKIYHYQQNLTYLA